MILFYKTKNNENTKDINGCIRIRIIRSFEKLNLNEMKLDDVGEKDKKSLKTYKKKYINKQFRLKKLKYKMVNYKKSMMKFKKN